MFTRRLPLTALTTAALLSTAPAIRAAPRAPELAFEKYKLPNGLEVILHQDPTAPTVHVEVWYKVGSKDETPGRTGFAHLFEHMMFQGTKQIPEDAFFKILAEAGASDRNGTTSFDRTNYYETLPSNQLETGLWLESSRMGFLLERPSFEATFANQREVVKNERRQSYENRPMGNIYEFQHGALYPASHPYRHTVIGSMADLEAARVDDIKAFFNRYYAPNNATLAIAGDIDVPATKALVEKYFGPIPPGPAVPHATFTTDKLPAERRLTVEAKVNQPAQFMTWNTMPLYAPGDAELDVLAGVLGGGKTSRLYKRLVYDLKIAQSVSVGQQSLMYAGQFEISVTPIAGHTLAEVQKVIDEELERVRTQPVDAKEIALVKNRIRTSFFRGLESVAGRAGLLQSYNHYTGDPGFIQKDLARYEAVDAAGLQKYAAAYLTKDARLIINVEPNPEAPIAGRLKG